MLDSTHVYDRHENCNWFEKNAIAPSCAIGKGHNDGFQKETELFGGEEYAYIYEGQEVGNEEAVVEIV